MLEPMHPKKRSRVGDVLVAVIIVVVIVGGIWLYSNSEKLLKPDESDCIEQLRAMTRREANYTQDEVVFYGRCLVERRE